MSPFDDPRLLSTATFSTNLAVTAFPPANYITGDTYSYYDVTSSVIFILALLLVLLNLVIVPKKYALHSVSVTWLVPYLYFTLFYSTCYTTEWISPMASHLKYIAAYFGFSLGSCCSADSIQGTTSELINNVGVILLILVALWVVYFILSFFTLQI